MENHPGFLAIGLFTTVNAEAQTEFQRQITFQDILASVKTNANSLTILKKCQLLFILKGNSFARELALVFTNSMTSDLGQCAAACYLGEIRDSNATDVLAAKIGLKFHWEKYPVSKLF